MSLFYGYDIVGDMSERLGVAQSEREDDIAKLERFIEQAMATYQAEGIPVGNNGRLQEQEFSKQKNTRGLYGENEIEKDLGANRRHEEEWVHEAPRRFREGEQLEILSHAIFLKNLGDEFAVVRASLHDDRRNKVDTLILDRKTGNLVCAFDEVGDTSGVDYEKKLWNVQKHNIDGGAALKYGIRSETINGRKVIIPSTAENIPIFYIALPSDRIKKGMQEFLPDMKNQSEFEKKLFAYFVATISAQISGLELYNKRLDPNLKKKLAAFKSVIENFKRQS